MKKNIFIFFGFLVVVFVLGCLDNVYASDVPLPVNFKLEIGQGDGPQQISTAIQIVFLLTVITLAPTLIIMVTSFSRIVIVLNFLKKAMGAGSQPSKEIIVGLALFMTVYIMAPVWKQINKDALKPFIDKKVSRQDAFEKGIVPLRNFMLKQTREKDLALFVHMTKGKKPKDFHDVPTFVLVPAFIISELKTGFQMGFIIYLPFLIIDMVVASVLLSMGMMMLPPVMVSFPFKILLFVMVDGWHILIRSLTTGFAI